jgi:hypothetical protein
LKREFIFKKGIIPQKLQMLATKLPSYLLESLHAMPFTQEKSLLALFIDYLRFNVSLTRLVSGLLNCQNELILGSFVYQRIKVQIEGQSKGI